MDPRFAQVRRRLPVAANMPRDKRAKLPRASVGSIMVSAPPPSDEAPGDRETMEYQGIDPDNRGPFAWGAGGFRPGGSLFS